MAKKKPAQGPFQGRLMALVLGNLSHFVKTPEEFYRWYHRRLVVAANDEPHLADWKKIRKCRDVRFRERCDNPRVCPYCWVRKIMRTIWPTWQQTPVEIYVFEDLDELGFEIIADSLVVAAGGCQWFRYRLPTDERRYRDHTIFLVPCGSVLLRNQFDEFVSAFGTQREFLTAPVETWIGAVRHNLQGLTSGKLGSVRGGKLSKLPIKPPLRELHPGLYSTLTAQAISRDCPEEQAAVEFQESLMTETSQVQPMPAPAASVPAVPPPAPETVALQQRVFWSLAYFALRPHLQQYVSRPSFTEMAAAAVDELQRTVQTVCHILGANETQLLGIMDIYEQNWAHGVVTGSFEEFLLQLQQNVLNQQHQLRMQQADAVFSQPAVPPQPPAPPPLQPPVPQQYIQPQPQYAQPQQFYANPTEAQQVKVAIESQQGPLVHGMPANMAAMPPAGISTERQVIPTPVQQTLPFGQGVPICGPEEAPFDTPGSVPAAQPPVAQSPTPVAQSPTPVALQSQAPVPPGLPSVTGHKVGDHVQFDLGSDTIRGFLTRVDGHMADMRTEQGHDYNQVNTNTLKPASGPVVLNASINFDVFSTAAQFVAMAEPVADRQANEVLQPIASVKSVARTGDPILLVLDAVNSGPTAAAEGPGPYYVCYIMANQNIVAHVKSKTFFDKWTLMYAEQQYELMTPRPDETSKKTVNVADAKKKKKRTKKAETEEPARTVSTEPAS